MLNIPKRLSFQHLLYLLLLTLTLVSTRSAFAQSRARIVGPVDESRLTTLKGHVAPQLKNAKDLGEIEGSQNAGRLLLMLQRSPEQEAALTDFLEQAHHPGSPVYHKWLTPESFGAKYGVGDEDIQKVGGWLQSHGLTVSKVNKGKTFIEFTGTVAQVSEALHTSYHNYELNGKTIFSVTSEPQVPAAFSGVVAGITNLSNISQPTPQVEVMGQAAYNPKTHTGIPQWTVPNSAGTLPLYFLAPEDFATQYDVKPVYAAGINGTGVSIGIIDEANVDLNLVSNFQKLFNLPVNPPQIIIDGNDPGITSASIETYLDLEVAAGVAPNATIKLYIAGALGLTSGYLPYAIVRAVDDDATPILSISFSSNEYYGTANNNFYAAAWEQAAAQGQSVFVSSGDSGVASPYGLTVNGIGSNAWATVVGGTDGYFSDYKTGGASIANYWSSSNDASLGSLQKVMTEQPWNGSQFGLNSILYDPVANQVQEQVGTGGGASYCAVGTGTLSSVTNEPICTAGWPKPSWQAGKNVPADGVRDLPDVSFFASNAINGVIWPICQAEGDCAPGATVGNGLFVTGVGGTSASTPAMAAVMALINQVDGPQGQANYVLYPLAAQFPSVFYPITLGSNNEPCNKGSYQCSLDAKDSYYSYQYYYANANGGYNQATGLGSIDVNQLVNNWKKITFQPTSTALTIGPTTITHGQNVAANITVTAINGTGTPTGPVSLVANTTLPNNGGLAQLTLSKGTATATLNSLPGGTYTVFANYGGDGVNEPSKSSPVTMTVAPEASTATLTGYSHSSAFNPTIVVIPQGGTVRIDYQPVFDVQIAGVASTSAGPDGVATGTVTFYNGSTALGVSSVNAAGIAEFNGGYLPVGSYSITATYSGDASFQPSTTAALNFSVVPQPNVSAFILQDPAAVVTKTSVTYLAGETITLTGLIPEYGYYQAVPLTGTLTYTLGSNPPVVTQLGPTLSQYVESTSGLSVVGQWTTATFANIQSTASLPGGTEVVTLTYSGDSNHLGISTTSTIKVLPSSLLPSTTTITLNSPSSASAITPSSLVTVTATVTGNGTIAPTGKVAGHLGQVLSFSPVTLVPGSNGTSTATFTFRAEILPSGDSFMTMYYPGDANYGTSSSTSIRITNTYSDFTLITPTPALAIKDGSSGTATVNITPQYSFSGMVNLTCTAPAQLTCTLASSSVNVTGTGVAGTTVTIGTVTNVAGATRSPFNLRMAGEGTTLAAGLLLILLPRRKRFAHWLALLFIGIGITAVTGCGSSFHATTVTGPTTQNAATGNYTVTVTGTGASGSHSVPITVTVQ